MHRFGDAYRRRLGRCGRLSGAERARSSPGTGGRTSLPFALFAALRRRRPSGAVRDAPPGECRRGEHRSPHLWPGRAHRLPDVPGGQPVERGRLAAAGAPALRRLPAQHGARAPRSTPTSAPSGTAPPTASPTSWCAGRRSGCRSASTTPPRAIRGPTPSRGTHPSRADRGATPTATSWWSTWTGGCSTRSTTRTTTPLAAGGTPGRGAIWDLKANSVRPDTLDERRRRRPADAARARALRRGAERRDHARAALHRRRHATRVRLPRHALRQRPDGQGPAADGPARTPAGRLPGRGTSRATSRSSCGRSRSTA